MHVLLCHCLFFLSNCSLFHSFIHSFRFYFSIFLLNTLLLLFSFFHIRCIGVACSFVAWWRYVSFFFFFFFTSFYTMVFFLLFHLLPSRCIDANTRPSLIEKIFLIVGMLCFFAMGTYQYLDFVGISIIEFANKWKTTAAIMYFFKKKKKKTLLDAWKKKHNFQRI